MPLSALRNDTTLVTISVGGNDAGFFDVTTTCMTGTDAQCAERVEVAKKFAREELPAKLDSLYGEIWQRSPKVRVVLGYPRLYEVLAFCRAVVDQLERAGRRVVPPDPRRPAAGRSARARAAPVDSYVSGR